MKDRVRKDGTPWKPRVVTPLQHEFVREYLSNGENLYAAYKATFACSTLRRPDAPPQA